MKILMAGLLLLLVLAEIGCTEDHYTESETNMYRDEPRRRFNPDQPAYGDDVPYP